MISIYEGTIKISVEEDEKFPILSKFYIESDKIIYTRILSLINQIGNKDFDINSQNDLEVIISVILTDYKLVENIVRLGVESNNISGALMLHEDGIINQQIVKFIRKSTFTDEDIIKYCNKTGSRDLIRLAERETFYKYVKGHNYFSCDYRELITKENFIDCGTSRAVFRIDEDYIMKVNLHEVGEIQSYNEWVVYNKPELAEYKDMLCAPLYVCKEYSIYRKYKSLGIMGHYNDEVRNEEYWEEMFDKDELEKFEKLLNILETYGIGQIDCRETVNLGVDGRSLKVLDYGGEEDLFLKLRSPEYKPKMEIFYEALDCAAVIDMSDENAKAEYKDLMYKHMKTFGIEVLR